MPERIVEADKSVFLAADVEPEVFPGLVAQMQGVEGLGGVKIGFELGLGLGLKTCVELVNDANPDLVSVYDHQKAGNDIPATSKNFARAMKRSGVDAAILFPFNGPVVERAWIGELQDQGVGVIVGGKMTHEQQASSEGGYIADEAFDEIFVLASEMDVADYVVPGNKPDAVEHFRELLEQIRGVGNFTLWAPGFVDQGGDVSATGLVAGPRFNAIVGGGIYKATDPNVAANELGAKMLALNNKMRGE